MSAQPARRIAVSLAVLIAGLLLVAGCTKVIVPPAIDLKTHEGIGLIQFKSNTEGKLDRFTTQKFLEAMTADQKVSVYELGTEDDVLKAVQKTVLDPEAIKAIGQKYGVKSVITGELDISDVRPKIEFGLGLEHIGVKADVEASLLCRMLETAGGATLWSSSAQSKRTVGEVSFFSGGHFSFDARDPESAYGHLIRELTRRTTREFRVTYRYK